MLYKLTYTDDMKSWQGGCARFWFIKIRPKYKNDFGLFRHELYHVRQFWASPITHHFRYRFSKEYRLQCEVEAYSEQLRWPPARDDTEWYRRCYAKSISTRYGLDITLEAAIELLE